MDPSIKYPAPGMVFVSPYSWTGHTGFVMAVNPSKGTITVKDSNWSDKNDELVRIHDLPISSILGLRKV